MTKTELLALAERLDDAPGVLGMLSRADLAEAASILRKFAALEPVAMVRVGLSATEIRFINQPRESAHLHNLTGIIDHE
jgi:hypothetical protein